MRLPFIPNYRLVGIDRVAVREKIPVCEVDLMTRDAHHAALLEWEFETSPYCFQRASEKVFSFARLPAVRVRDWMEERGLPFELISGLDRQEVPTWVQSAAAAT